MNLNKQLSISVITLLIASGSTFAQVKKKPAASPKGKPVAAQQLVKNDVLPVDKQVIIGKLPNGLTYYIRQNVEPKNKAELYLVNKVGSVLETDDQQGLAHFTEHMAFNGTRDFPKNQMVDYLQKSGVKFGADLNAYTSFNETVYQLPIPTDTAAIFNNGFKILANWAGYVSFDPTEIDKERGVVLEEERLRGKNAQERLQQQILPVLLNNSRYALRLPIGKEDILKNFKPETIKSFYHDWYRPDLQAVIAVGDFDPKQVEELIKQNFSGLQNPTGEKPRVKYTVPAAPGTSVKIATDKEFPYTLAEIVVKHPGTTVKTTTDYMQSVRVQLFNQMLNSRLGELLQKPNPPFLFGRSSYGGFLGEQNAFTSVAVAKPGELEGAVKAVVAETERARKFGFTLTELERAKQDALVQMGNAYKERDKTRSANFVREYQQNFLEGEAIPGIEYEYNFYVNNINKITVAQMNALAGSFIGDQNRVVIVEAPEKDKATLPTEATLLQWIGAAGQGVTAYIDNVSSDPLLSKLPEGTKVVNTVADSLIGTTTLTLGNGLKVILKPTEFRNDQILINGYAFGGSSLASDDDFTSANMASSIIASSGIAQFNQGMLDKKMAGKNVNISPYISEFAQGITGSSSPADFETALQLIYLYFTQPRKDNDIWQSTIAQTKSVLANRGLDPPSVFQDTVSAVLSNYNFRGMITKPERLNAATLDKAYNFYKNRFADASNFTFTLVGNFDIETVKPYLEHYLGGLPSTNGKETFKDLKIQPPAGEITKIVNKGVAEKSSVQLVFSGDYDYNDANNIQMDALEEVLNIKLIERLREQESGVYSPGVRAGYHKTPGGRYTITVYFGCAPENVDKMIASTLDEIAKIKQNGAQPTDIQKFVAEEARSTREQMKENIFWAGYLASSSQNGENPDQILQHVGNLEQVTVQSTKDAANKYLSGKNFIKLILMPEKK
ncbi:M16 family metallopeptidase [Mucilaginibacter sp. FT3.2]|uniref:M16 family metallopeptidase n=1 Tax=Mucilaginibacter sp. FT3.2 TaxID=2723090 RepID=UPI00160E92BE|nr:M16 family metallopeptidase [Mucilaginibacter sp. FT3.2]MBB6232327.1 zinc protease [Mucilaginibacter sp. FT3.2]